MGEQKTLIELRDYELLSPAGEFLSKLSFKLMAGELVVLRGGNGSGKSTLLRKIFSQIQARSKPEKEMYLSKFEQVSYLPQSLDREFYIPLNLKNVAELNQDIDPSSLEILLDNNLMTKSWNKASGGEKQRALLAQTLLVDSSLYILDEPFNHLDEQAIKKVIEVIKKRTIEQSSFLISTHNVAKSFDLLSSVTKNIELKQVEV